MCSAVRHLPIIQGCSVPTPRPFARYAGIEFDRCPLTYITVRATLLIRDYMLGALSSSGEEKLKLTAKQLACLNYVEFLKKVSQPVNDDRT